MVRWEGSSDLRSSSNRRDAPESNEGMANRECTDVRKLPPKKEKEGREEMEGREGEIERDRMIE